MGLDIMFYKIKKGSKLEKEVNSEIKNWEKIEDLFFDEEESENRNEILYFRKFNFIVSFFEKNTDDKIMFAVVNKSDLKNLVETARKVLKDESLAPELLPTCAGFFFGNTKYNSFYFDDLRYMNYEIEKIIDFIDDNENLLIWFSW